MHQQLETLWRKIKSKVEGLAGGPACTEEEEKHRGPGRPSRLRSLTEQEAISGQKLGLHAASAWALHVSAPVLLAGSLRPGRGEERDPGSPGEEPQTRDGQENLTDRYGRERLRGTAGRGLPLREEDGREGTEIGFSGSIMQGSITFPAMCLRALGFVPFSYLHAGDRAQAWCR